MKLSALPTKKLFYGKWCYKITCKVHLAWIIKRLGARETINFCINPTLKFSAVKSTDDQRRYLEELTTAVMPFLENNVQLRAKGSLLSIYCKDKDLYDRMCHDLSKFIKNCWEPTSPDQKELIESNSKKIICRHLPFHRYRFRVELSSKTPARSRESFHLWLQNYGNTVHCPGAAKLFFTGRYVPAPYFYVEDERFLSMLHLFLGDNIKKVWEYVPVSSINTRLQP